MLTILVLMYFAIGASIAIVYAILSLMSVYVCVELRESNISHALAEGNIFRRILEVSLADHGYNSEPVVIVFASIFVVLIWPVYLTWVTIRGLVTTFIPENSMRKLITKFAISLNKKE